jgi:hypothetical protein
MPNGRSHTQPGSVYRQRTLRLDPNRVRASALARAGGTRRWAYNWALEQQKQAYAATGRFLGPAEQMRSIVRLGGDAAERPGVRLPGLWPAPGSRPQRGPELEVVGPAVAGRPSRRREGGDSKRLWSQGKTRPAGGG